MKIQNGFSLAIASPLRGQIIFLMIFSTAPEECPLSDGNIVKVSLFISGNLWSKHPFRNQTHFKDFKKIK